MSTAHLIGLDNDEPDQLFHNTGTKVLLLQQIVITATDLGGNELLILYSVLVFKQSGH